MTTLIATLNPLSNAGALLQRWRQFFAAADRHRDDDPARNATAEAASVRELADSYRRSDPGFASDLYAAADRHEREAEAAAGR